MVNTTRMKVLAATLGLIFLGGWCAAAERPPLNVVLITVDTLRPDHLGCYGYRSVKTPTIDGLAEHGIRFAHAFTPVPITLPAHTALLTGEFPLATGIHDFTGNKVRAGTETLARILRGHGYTTAAFIAAAVLDRRFGLNQGFDTYYDHFDFGHGEEVHLDFIERRGDQVVNEALKWLKSNPKRPLFMWVHLYDAHTPYAPPEPFASRYHTHPYDGEIAFVDAQLGRFFASLKQQGLYENSLIVLVSDHGESLGEHGEKTHGFFIYNSTLHVAMIFKIPGVAPRVVEDGASLVDVLPTVLQALKIPIPSSVQGRSLLSLALGRPTGSQSVLYAESYPPLLHFGWNLLRGLQWHGLKYIETTRPELYDTRTDPKELHNLVDTHHALAQQMRERLHDVIGRYTPASGKAKGEKELTDPALLESLRSLGYVAVSSGDIVDSSGKALPDPKDRIGVYELISAAMVDAHQGRHDESLRKLKEAEKTEPNLLSVRYLMGRDYFHLKDFHHAAECFQAALKLNPKYTLAAFDLGNSQLAMGDAQAAVDSFKRTLELDASNFTAAYDLGVAYTRLRQPDAAIQAFQRAVEILPDYAEAHEAIGELYLYLRRPQDAARELQRAVAIDPKMAKAHFELGRAYEALGLPQKAQEEFDRAKAR
jgi:arylsulfatase A-like enzyme/Tfp pilus assembly protein PilF